MAKAHEDIYRRVVAEIEHELKSGHYELTKLDEIDKAVKQLRDYERERKEGK